MKPLKIAVASGKGGTGKTTVAINLFASLQAQSVPVQLIDCDVEVPNDRVFFPDQEVEPESVLGWKAEIDLQKCQFCGRCAEACVFNAILFLGKLKQAKILSDLCNGCGVCSYVCPHGAIVESQEVLGEIRQWSVGPQAQLCEGRLSCGKASPVPVIAATQEKTQAASMVIYDAPPGTSCAFMEAVAPADLVLLVAEPTPFGLNDLRLSAAVLRKLNKPMAVVMNRTIGDQKVWRTFLESEKLDLWAEIPFDRKLAASYSSGEIWITKFPEMKTLFLNLLHSIEDWAGQIPAICGKEDLLCQ